MSEDGEIPLLDADRLHEGIPAKEEEGEKNDDERALLHIADRLRSSRPRPEDQIEELAADLYNKICQQIRSGRMTEEQLAHFAELLGESSQSLRDRL